MSHPSVHPSRVVPMGERWRGPRPSTWQPGSPKGRAVLADVLDRYRQHEAEDTLPRSGRGIFYDLRPRGFGRGVTYVKRSKDRRGWWDSGAIDAKRGRFGPMEVGPDYVQEIVADARRAGLIDEDWVADARAPDPRLPDVWDGAEQFARWVTEQARDFRLDRQDGQPVYVELWCEAGDLINQARLAIRAKVGQPRKFLSIA
jgi:hypothetical protein